jgi:hypothetical protein
MGAVKMSWLSPFPVFWNAGRFPSSESEQRTSLSLLSVRRASPDPSEQI